MARKHVEEFQFQMKILRNQNDQRGDKETCEYEYENGQREDKRGKSGKIRRKKQTLLIYD